MKKLGSFRAAAAKFFDKHSILAFFVPAGGAFCLAVGVIMFFISLGAGNFGAWLLLSVFSLSIMLFTLRAVSDSVHLPGNIEARALEMISKHPDFFDVINPLLGAKTDAEWAELYDMVKGLRQLVSLIRQFEAAKQGSEKIGQEIVLLKHNLGLA